MSNINELSQERKEALFKATKITAETGNVEAMKVLGDFYYEGFVVEKDVAKAIENWKKAAEKDNKDALYKLSVLYYSGTEVEPDEDYALDCLKKSARLSNPDALYSLGRICEKGYFGENLLAHSAECYKVAAELGHIQAIYDLAHFYLNGKFVEVDDKKALEYFEVAAKAGVVDAQLIVEAMKNDPDFGNKARAKNHEFDEEFKKVKLSADSGDADSQCYIGKAYEVGAGTYVNFKSAKEYYLSAGEKGCGEAYFRLANMYAGRRVNQYENITEAIKYWEKAIELGYHKAGVCLAIIYMLGFKTPQDVEKGNAYLMKACEESCAEAITFAENISKATDPEELRMMLVNTINALMNNVKDEFSSEEDLKLDEEAEAERKRRKLANQIDQMFKDAEKQADREVVAEKLAEKEQKKSSKAKKESSSKNAKNTTKDVKNDTKTKEERDFDFYNRYNNYDDYNFEKAEFSYNKYSENKKQYLKKVSEAEKKAKSGDPQAECELANLYVDGLFGTANYKKAKTIYDKYVTQENVDALVGLGKIYLLGLGVDVDIKQAEELLNKAYKLGSKKSAVYLALISFKTDKNVAFNYLDEAIAENIPEAHMVLSSFYSDYVESSVKTEAYDLQKGVSILPCNWGSTRNGDIYVVNEARKEMLEAMKSGDMGALRAFVPTYEEQENVLTLLALNGDLSAFNKLGLMYLNKGVVAKGLSFLNMGANEGDSDCCYNMAFCYNYGLGVEKDKEKAKELLKKTKAVEADVLLAEIECANGNDAEEIKLLKKAIKNKVPKAIIKLSWYYEKGFGGLKKNLNTAEKLLVDGMNDQIGEVAFELYNFYNRQKIKKAEADKILERCAYEFYVGKAFYELGKIADRENRKADALNLFWQGYLYGHLDSFARYLDRKIFYHYQLCVDEGGELTDYIIPEVLDFTINRNKVEDKNAWVNAKVHSVTDCLKSMHECSDKGSKDAAYFLYLYYKNGFMVEKNAELSDKMLVHSSILGDEDATCTLAERYFKNGEFEKSRELLEEIADFSGRACYYLYLDYSYEANYNSDLAMKYLRRAAEEHRFVHAELELAKLYTYGLSKGIDKDYGKAVHWFWDVKDHLPYANENIKKEYFGHYGYALMMGKEYKNIYLAETVLKEGIKEGDPRSSVVLAMLYYADEFEKGGSRRNQVYTHAKKGFDFYKDYEAVSAVDQLTKAHAYYIMGMCLKDGLGVAKNKALAEQYLNYLDNKTKKK